MNMLNFINEYQTLIGALLGSFLAVLSSLFLWYLKEQAENRKLTKNNHKEIENIFFMATRESEDAFKDIQLYVHGTQASLKKKSKGLSLSIPPRFNRIHVNEERLAIIKQGLSFLVSQQIDIAVSSAKKFNGYLDHFEHQPVFIFDATTKLIQSGVLSKEEAIKEYSGDQMRYLSQISALLDKEIITVQRHLFRPIVAQLPKYRKIPRGVDVDKDLDAIADIMVRAMKQDLS